MPIRVFDCLDQFAPSLSLTNIQQNIGIRHISEPFYPLCVVETIILKSVSKFQNTFYSDFSSDGTFDIVKNVISIFR